MKKKREYQSSELVKSFAKIYGFENKLLALQVKDFLEDYLDERMFQEIESVNLNRDKILEIKITVSYTHLDVYKRQLNIFLT